MEVALDTAEMSILDIELNLMAAAHFWGDYSVLHPLTSKNSSLYNAFQSQDVHVVRRYAHRFDRELSGLGDDQNRQFAEILDTIAEKYRNALSGQPVPLPESYWEELAHRAVEMGNFTSAHSAWNAIQKLDKGVNHFIVKGSEVLQSAAVRDEADHDDFVSAVAGAANSFYIATRVKNPLQHQFQYKCEAFHGSNHDIMRKYFKYIEAGLQKEIIETGIEYLIDDSTISTRITGLLPNAKARREFLKQLAILFSRSPERYAAFIDSYQKAVQLLNNAKTEDEYKQIQRILLGRYTAENEYYQYLRELAVDHPVSTLLVHTLMIPDNKLYLVPILMKSGQPLAEYLELNRM